MDELSFDFSFDPREIAYWITQWTLSGLPIHLNHLNPFSRIQYV